MLFFFFNSTLAPLKKFKKKFLTSKKFNPYSCNTLRIVPRKTSKDKGYIPIGLPGLLFPSVPPGLPLPPLDPTGPTAAGADGETFFKSLYVFFRSVSSVLRCLTFGCQKLNKQLLYTRPAE